jgi:bacteriocin biosynthesis cyclodehydratase domain-containing protein
MGRAVQLRAGDERIHVLSTDPPELADGVLRRLDGLHDRASLIAQVGPEHGGAIDELLEALIAHDWLMPQPAEGDSERDTGGEIASYLAQFASEAGDPARALAMACVAVAGHAPAAGLFVQMAVEHGIAAAHCEPRAIGAHSAKQAPDALICVCESPDLTLLFELSDAACRLRLACLFVDLSHGKHATIGPFFVPGQGACYRCLRARLHENTAAHSELVAAERQMLETGQPLPFSGRLPAHRHWVLGMAMSEVVALIAQHRPLRTLNRALTIDLEGMRVWSEPVWRVPWCASCGQAGGPA